MTLKPNLSIKDNEKYISYASYRNTSKYIARHKPSLRVTTIIEEFWSKP